MADLYSIVDGMLITSTIAFNGESITTQGQPYEEIIADLCRCMLQAIAVDDADGKMLIGSVIYVTLGRVMLDSQ